MAYTALAWRRAVKTKNLNTLPTDWAVVYVDKLLMELYDVLIIELHQQSWEKSWDRLTVIQADIVRKAD